MAGFKMVETLRKKIHQLGASYAVIIPKKWLDKNRLKLNDEVELIFNNDYVLVKDCKDPFMNDLQPQEIEGIETFTKLRKAKVEEVRRVFKQAQKELDEGKGQDITDVPLFPNALQSAMAKQSQSDEALEEFEKQMRIKVGNKRFEKWLGAKQIINEEFDSLRKEKSDKGKAK